MFTLHDLTNSEEWQSFMESKSSHMFINDPDRAERCWEAAEHGAEGSTHAECIDDQRDFIDCCGDDLGLTDEDKDRLFAELDEVEIWHELNGSLFEQVG